MSGMEWGGHASNNVLATTETCYAALFCCFTFAHLTRWAAAIFLRAAADMVRLGCTGATPFDDAVFAHRAFCARLIFLRAAADRVCLGFVYKLPPLSLPSTDRAASMCFSWLTKFVLSALSSDTIDTNPVIAIGSPSILIVLSCSGCEPQTDHYRAWRHPKSNAVQSLDKRIIRLAFFS